MRLGFAFLCEEVRLYDETSPAPAPLPPREERELGVTAAMQRKADAEAAAEAANAAAKEGRSINIRAGKIGYTEVVAEPRPLLSVMQLVFGPDDPEEARLEIEVVNENGDRVGYFEQVIEHTGPFPMQRAHIVYMFECDFSTPGLYAVRWSVDGRVDSHCWITARPKDDNA